MEKEVQFALPEWVDKKKLCDPSSDYDVSILIFFFCARLTFFSEGGTWKS
jgi:hypothetical protein